MAGFYVGQRDTNPGSWYNSKQDVYTNDPYEGALYAAGQGDKNAWTFLSQVQNQNAQLAFQRDQIAAQNKQAAAATELSNKYLDQWQQHLGEVQNMFSSANSGIDSASAGISDLGDVAATIKANADKYQTMMDPIVQNLMDQTATESASRTKMLGQLDELATADTEGAAGRAAADVSKQAEIARQNSARELAKRGIYGGAQSATMLDQNFLAEGLGRVGAMNKARIDERNRAGEYVKTGLQYIDPSKTATSAGNIAGISANLYNQYGNIASTKANLLGNLAGLKGNLATAYANAVAEPVGQLGATMLGRDVGLTGGQTGFSYSSSGGGYSTPTTAFSDTGTGSSGTASLQWGGPTFNPMNNAAFSF